MKIYKDMCFIGKYKVLFPWKKYIIYCDRVKTPKFKILGFTFIKIEKPFTEHVG